MSDMVTERWTQERLGKIDEIKLGSVKAGTELLQRSQLHWDVTGFIP